MCANQNTSVTPIWHVGQSVFSTLTVLITVPASIIDVKIHVLEHVVLVLNVKLWIVYQSASVHFRWQEIHFSPAIHLGLVWNTSDTFNTVNTVLKQQSSKLWNCLEVTCSESVYQIAYILWTTLSSKSTNKYAIYSTPPMPVVLLTVCYSSIEAVVT